VNHRSLHHTILLNYPSADVSLPMVLLKLLLSRSGLQPDAAQLKAVPCT
jgi:hypothetical protein